LFGVEASAAGKHAPLVAANRDGHSILQLGDRVIAVYRRDLPPAASGNDFSVDWMRWARPIMLLAMVLFGSSYFVKAKAGAGVGMGGVGRYGGAMTDARRAEALLRAGVGGAHGARMRTPAFGGVGGVRSAGRGFGRVPRAPVIDEDNDLPPLYGPE
jgi:hypothetical protein